ncbi:unnamed protein product [Orchesella dallaii]|uniref:Uncharacterized protein n=1 Tax=Orchesella dallaii TaxID=48710 RepID=A0ABP1S1Y4_9HEXA
MSTSMSVVRGDKDDVPNDEVNKVRKVPPQQSTNQMNSQFKLKSCPNCGSKSHQSSRDSPHKEVECFGYGGKVHFKKHCRKTNSSEINHHQDNAPHATLHIYVNNEAVNSASFNTKKNIWITINVNGVPHDMELDTGCEQSLLSQQFWREGLCP